MSAIEIDGSQGEGGGQIIRNAVSFACLLRKKLRVTNIRAGRPNPGLASQHLESLLALIRVTQASSPSKLEKGVTEFELDGTCVAPPDSEGVYTTIDLKTAGSTSLCIQSILPYLLTLSTPSQIKIIGGTHVLKAPNYDYLARVFVPIMNRFLNYNIDIKMDRPGYFPRGGGMLKLFVNSQTDANKPPHFHHFTMKNRGNLLRTHAILNVTQKISYKTNEFYQRVSGDTRSIEVRNVPYASVEYFLEFENSWAGFYYLAPGRNPRAEDIFEGIQQVHEDYERFLGSSAVLDEFMQDQVIMYMALAKHYDPQGTSEIYSGPLTDHTKSAIDVAHMFLEEKHRFVVESVEGSNQTFSIRI